MKRTFGIWLLALAVFLPACQKDGPGGETAAVKDLTVLFTPGHSFSGASYDDGILKVMAECEAAWPNMELHLIRPEDDRQASSLIEAWKAGEGADKALILCGPTYESLVGEASPGQGRILIVDSNKEFSGAISTLQMKRYGGAWLAGALSKHLTLTIIKAYDGDRMMDTVAQGIEDGFLEAGGENCLHIVLSDGYEGTSMPDELFNILYANPETYFQTNACLRFLQQLLRSVHGNWRGLQRLLGHSALLPHLRLGDCFGGLYRPVAPGRTLAGSPGLWPCYRPREHPVQPAFL